MHNAYHPKSNVDRIYLPRNDGGRGLLSVEYTINTTNLGLEEHVVRSDERILSAARNIDEVTETAQDFKKRKKNERQDSWKGERITLSVSEANRRGGRRRTLVRWLRGGNLKRETESLIIATQEQAIRKNLI